MSTWLEIVIRLQRRVRREAWLDQQATWQDRHGSRWKATQLSTVAPRSLLMMICCSPLRLKRDRSVYARLLPLFLKTRPAFSLLEIAGQKRP